MHLAWYNPWYWLGIWLAGWWLISILATVVVMRASDESLNLRHMVYVVALISLLWPVIVGTMLLLVWMVMLVGIPAKIILCILERRDQRRRAHIMFCTPTREKWNL